MTVSFCSCKDELFWAMYGLPFRALSSVGRAPDLHSGGQEFDSPSVHHPRFISCFYYIIQASDEVLIISCGRGRRCPGG